MLDSSQNKIHIESMALIMTVNTSSENLIAGSSNLISVQEVYGKLIMPRFYGPAARLKEIIIITGLIFFTGILSVIGYILSSDFISRIAGGGLLIFLVCISIMMYMKLKKDFKEAPTYRDFEIKGKLDCDLYENGILIKGFATNIPGHLVTAFIPFKEISEIYISKDKDKINKIIEIVRQKEKTNSIQSVINEEIDEKTIKSYRKYIWLIINGKPRAMERFLFKDLHAFIKYVKNKNIGVI